MINLFFTKQISVIYYPPVYTPPSLGSLPHGHIPLPKYVLILGQNENLQLQSQNTIIIVIAKKIYPSCNIIKKRKT